MTEVAYIAESCEAGVNVRRQNEVFLGGNKSPSKAMYGIPSWYEGKVSAAFAKHIFWPSPPKKATTKAKKVLFPACASTSE